MEIFNKARKLDIFWRKVILFAILFVLAVPFFALVLNGFSSRFKDFKDQGGLGQFKIGEVPEELGQSLLEIQEAREGLSEEINKWQESATTSTSTLPDLEENLEDIEF